jgi:hypothetical protein
MRRNFDLAIADLEKALELGLPPDEEQKARNRLSELYGGGLGGDWEENG